MAAPTGMSMTTRKHGRTGQPHGRFSATGVTEGVEVTNKYRIAHQEVADTSGIRHASRRRSLLQ
jgi:hypothetical protein